VVKRREFLAMVGRVAILWPPGALAQQAGRVRRVAAVPLGPAHAKAFREGLDKLGWTEGQNIHTEYRYVSGSTDRIDDEVAKLVALSPEVILSGGTETTTALQQITRTIPIVFVHVADPISAGLVQSLVQPGGNLTGFTAQESSIGAKWLEVLKEIAPNIGDVLVLVDPQNPTWREHLETIQAAAPSVRVQITATHARTPAQVAHAIETFAGKPNAGAIILPSLLTRDEGEQILTHVRSTIGSRASGAWCSRCTLVDGRYGSSVIRSAAARAGNNVGTRLGNSASPNRLQWHAQRRGVSCPASRMAKTRADPN
jgi:putative ABC transport system substrate-binding protein